MLIGLSIDSKADIDVLPLKNRGRNIFGGPVSFGSRLIQGQWYSKCGQLVLIVSEAIIDLLSTGSKSKIDE